MYIDSDGDTILETTDEIMQYARVCQCHQCIEEAVAMVAWARTVEVRKLVFTTTCNHQ